MPMIKKMMTICMCSYIMMCGFVIFGSWGLREPNYLFEYSDMFVVVLHSYVILIVYTYKVGEFMFDVQITHRWHVI